MATMKQNERRRLAMAWEFAKCRREGRLSERAAEMVRGQALAMLRHKLRGGYCGIDAEDLAQDVVVNVVLHWRDMRPGREVHYIASIVKHRLAKESGRSARRERPFSWTADGDRRRVEVWTDCIIQ